MQIFFICLYDIVNAKKSLAFGDQLNCTIKNKMIDYNYCKVILLLSMSTMSLLIYRDITYRLNIIMIHI